MQDDRFPENPPGQGGQIQAAGTAVVPAEPRPPAAELGPIEPEQRGDAAEIDLLAYWRMLVKRRWLIASVAAAGLVLGVLSALTTTPMYRATAVLQIERQVLQDAYVGGMPMMLGGWGWDFYETQHQLLRSRALAERTADRLDLADPASRPAPPPSWSARLMGLVRPGAADPARAAAEDSGPAPTTAELEARMRSGAGLVRSGTTIEPVMESALVRIHYDSWSPAFAARVANALGEEFIAQSLERRFGASSYAQTYLEEQLALTKSRLEESERELVAFAQKENLILGAEGESLVGQSLASLNSALATAQQQRIRAQARWQQAQAAAGAALPPDMLGNSILRTLQQQRAQLQGQYREQLQIYKPEYPSMLQLREQIAEVDGQIGTELAGIRASVRAEYNAAMQQERLLLAQLGELRDQSLDVDSRSIDYNILKREVDTNRQMYDALLQRYKEVGVASNLGSNNITIVDRAQVPGGAFKPNLGRSLLIGLVLGLIVGVLVAVLREFLDDTIKSPEDVEQRLRLAVLGVVPKLGRKQTVTEASADLRSAFSEAYRSVRTALQFSTEQGVPRVLLVTSASPGEGKSTTSLALARNFAQMGKRVLLIEADLRNPSLGRNLRLAANAGLSNVLAGACQAQDATVATGTEGLEAILAGPLPPNPAELLSGARLVSLLTRAAGHYDQVVIDGPPVLGLADAPILANVADGTLLVVEAGQARTGTVQSAVKRLLGARARLLGALLIKYDARASGYGYDYASYYGYGGPPRLPG